MCVFVCVCVCVWKVMSIDPSAVLRETLNISLSGNLLYINLAAYLEEVN